MYTRIGYKTMKSYKAIPKQAEVICKLCQFYCTGLCYIYIALNNESVLPSFTHLFIMLVDHKSHYKGPNGKYML